jgi:hypothetical protein
MSQSAFIAYFDESGDHGMDNIDADFPAFVLCGCLFKIEDYLKSELSAFSRIKFDHFGHDTVVFHSREIRKRLGPFQIFTNTAKREKFMADMSAYFSNSTGTLIAAGIHKTAHKKQYVAPTDPYSLSLLFCLERLYGCLKDRGETGETMFCVFEQRGPNEDQALALRFEKICSGENQWGKLPFRMVYANKQTNMPGLQFADLAAYPIARFVIDQQKKNPAYEVLEKKFRRSPTGKVLGWGLKLFP